MYIQGNSSSSWWFLKVLLALVTLSQIFHNVLFVFLARTTTSFYKSDHADSRLLLVVFFVLACDFCRLCGAIRFFHPATTANDLRLRRIAIPDFIHYIYFPILILEEEPVFPFWMLSAKQGNYWYHFYYDFGMTRSLTGDWTPGPPALEASTLPLYYRGGGVYYL